MLQIGKIEINEAYTWPDLRELVVEWGTVQPCFSGSKIYFLKIQ